MSLSLPKTAAEFMKLGWGQIAPFYSELQDREVGADNVEQWLSEWTDLSRLINETSQRLYVATSVNTADRDAEKRLFYFLEHINPPAEAAEQKLREKLLATKLDPAGFEIPLRNMRAQAALYREENLALFTEERKLENEYNKVIGSQTLNWQDKDITVTQLRPVYQSVDRSLREKAWRLASSRQLADREAINELWVKFMSLRKLEASNADCPDYRAFRWKQLLRFDYSPENCAQFHDAIEQAVVPAAERIYERRRKQLGVDSLRPWDLDVDPSGQPALRPYKEAAELINKTAVIFHQLDPRLREYFDTMRKEDLLDLDNRRNKAPGGYCTSFAVVKRPFIFMNAVGVHDDVQTLLHESGHAFHYFESAHLPYAQQQDVGMEFAEVASMSMELLGLPYLSSTDHGFYSKGEAARASIEHLEGLILFWPYMAVVDAFQHWVYTHHDEATQPAACDAAWAAEWKRFMRGVDWSGLEQEMMTGWHRKLHIHVAPFYYVEYGLAQLGAVQVWRNSLRHQADAIRAYRHALSLGGTAALPELYRTAGAQFSFDAGTLRDAIDVIEGTIAKLSAE